MNRINKKRHAEKRAVFLWRLTSDHRPCERLNVAGSVAVLLPRILTGPGRLVGAHPHLRLVHVRLQHHPAAQRRSASSGTDADTAGCTSVRDPLSTHARKLGSNRGAKRPSLISRVTKNRLKDLGER